MSIHPEIQAMGPKERFERVVELATQAHVDYQIWLHGRRDQMEVFEAIERYENTCQDLIIEFNLLIETGVIEQVADCLSVIYGQ